MNQHAIPASKRRLETPDDIKLMVDSFYERVRKDDLIGPIFDEIVKVDWETHLPRMYTFWETVAFQQAGYKGDPIGKHQAVARQVALKAVHFERWLLLFDETVDALFDGRIAEMVKHRAQIMSHAIMFKCAQQVL